VFVILVVGGVLAAGYFWFLPHDTIQTISGYSVSTVTVKTLQDTVELSGVVTARSEATVTAPEAGTMGTLLVSEGDWVTKGQLIAILETEDLNDQLASEQSQLERQLREYDRFQLQNQYDVRGYDRKRNNLVDDLGDAQDELDETQELYDIGSASRSELLAAQDKVDTAQDAIDDHDAEVEEAQAIYELNKSNNEDDIQAIRDSIADLQARVSDARVRSPMTGRVISVADEATRSGERITQYQTLMDIADSRNPLIETEIEEQYVSAVAVGQPVAVDISGTRVAGVVERVGLTATSSSDGGTPTVELDVAVDVGDSEITIGTSTIVEVLIGEVPDAVILPRGPYLTSGNREYLYRVEGNTAQRIRVTYGTITDDAVQIVSGVEPGDRIITSSYTNFIDSETVELGGNE